MEPQGTYMSVLPVVKQWGDVCHSTSLKIHAVASGQGLTQSAKGEMKKPPDPSPS